MNERDMENLKELKMMCLRNINNKDEIPEDVMRIVDRTFNDLLELYSEKKLCNPSIKSYTEGILYQVKIFLKKDVGERRRAQQEYEVKSVLYEMERNLEELQDEEEQRKSEIQYTERFSEIRSNNEDITRRICDSVKDALRNIQAKQNTILDSREYNQRTIEDLQDEVIRFINHIDNRIGQEIYNAFQSDDKGLQNWMLGAYEEYLNEKNKNARENKGDSFKKSLNADISLEKQQARALEFQKRQSNFSDENRDRQSQFGNERNPSGNLGDFFL